MPRADRTFTVQDYIRIWDNNLTEIEQRQAIVILCGRMGLPFAEEQALVGQGIMELINGIIFALRPNPITIAEILLSPFIFALERVPEEDILLEDLKTLNDRFGTGQNKETERLIDEYFKRSRR